MNNKIKCVGYFRFGNSSQLEIEKKKSVLKKYADSHNLEIEKIEAEHLSGLKQSAILNQLIEQENVKNVLVPNISSISRNPIMLFGFMDKSESHNTRIISMDGSIEAMCHNMKKSYTVQ